MDTQNRRGMTLVISGPSGAGKSTIFKEALKRTGGFEFSVSCTTRAPRPGEVDGVDYHFVTREVFQEKIAAGEFAEYAEVHGNFYGTLKSELDHRMDRGIDVLLDIDVQGALRLQELAKIDESFRKALEFVFILPPSFAELEKRLRGRGTETEESLQKRLANAKREVACWPRYNYLLVNDVLADAVDRFTALIVSLRMSVKRLDAGKGW